MTETRKEQDSPQRFRKWIRTPLGYLLIGFSAAVFSVGIYAGAQFFYQKQVAAPQSQGLLDNPASAADTSHSANKDLLAQTSQGFRYVAKKVGPAVVTIQSTKKPNKQTFNAKRQQRRQGPEEFDEQDPFFDFFERFGFGAPFFGNPMPDTPQVGLGSGFIIDKKGHVVTNNHVVRGATEIIIRLQGSNVEYKTKVLGTDAKSDLAVLKIESPKSLPEPVEWGDSDKLEVGDWALAIGNPFNIGQSLTAGIISATTGRNSMVLTGAEYAGDLIQTDAAINPGNSGGPLCNIEGQVIGVNEAIFTRSGGYMGIGFAIPSKTAKYVVTTLIGGGKIVRGWLGVYIQPLQADLAEELNIKNGVSVHEVIADSPAAKAGLQPGDVIIEIDGKAVESVNQLQTQVSQAKPGQTLSLKIVSYTDKSQKAVKVKIGELPEEETVAESSQTTGEPDKLGLVVNSTRGKEGVIVELVRPGSVGAEVGLEVGDVISRINRQKVDSVAGYNRAIKSATRFFMQVKRKGRNLFFQFSIPK